MKQNEYFELFKILEDGDTEHIDQYRYRNDLNVWLNICKDYLCTDKNENDFYDDPYNFVYKTEIKRYLKISYPQIIEYFQNKHPELDINNDDNIEIRIMSSLDYRNYDKQYDNELKFVEYIMSEKAKEDKQTIITEELLIDNGFEYLERESNLTQDYQNQLYGKDNYKIFRKWTNDSSPLKLDIDNGVNNRGTEWHLHIDNDHCESIGSADIDNVWEFNTLMEVFGSKFRL